MEILQSETLRGKFALLFTHQNEHLHVLTRSVFMLVYFVFGSIDFKILVLISNVALLGLLFFAYKTLPEKQEKIFLLIPAALLLFQLKQNWVHLIWAMEALAALYVLFFAEKVRQIFLVGFVFFSYFCAYSRIWGGNSFGGRISSSDSEKV